MIEMSEDRSNWPESKPRNLREEANRFVEENPQVYDLFKRFARQARENGRKFGAKLIAERVRWEVAMNWEPDKHGFKLNNNHVSYIARRLLEDMPEIEGLIELRKTHW